MSEKKVVTPDQIDYSDLPVQPAGTNEENWEPPPHVYYGKRDPKTGRSVKEPVYVYQEFPRILYIYAEGRLSARQVNDTAEKEKYLAQGYGLSPGDFGIETAPARPEVVAHERARKAEEPVLVTETVQIVKRKAGRPPKSATA